MEEKLDSTLEELINSFNEDEDFQEYFRIREKVKNNKEIMELISFYQPKVEELEETETETEIIEDSTNEEEPEAEPLEETE